MKRLRIQLCHKLHGTTQKNASPKCPGEKSCPGAIKSRFGTSIHTACLRAHHHPAGGPGMGLSCPERRFYPTVSRQSTPASTEVLFRGISN